MVSKSSINGGGRSRAIKNALARPLDRATIPIDRVSGVSDVFFTFDDGPHPTYTMAVAETLEATGHRGTFFLTGANTERHPDVARRLVSGGHAVGSHSATHPRSRHSSASAVVRDYLRGHRAVQEAVGRSVPWFRPPYGAHDRRSSAASLLCRAQVVLWSCDSEDWRPEATAAAVMASVEAHLVAGAIVLFHDAIMDEPAAAERGHTVEAVGQLIERLGREGRRSLALGGDRPATGI